MKNSKTVSVIAVMLLAVSLYMILPPTAKGEGTALVKVKGIPLTVEIADKPAERSLGLMYRKNLPENKGMLFIYKRPATMNFWMKNTYVPLSIAYIDTNGYIIAIFKMEPLNEKKIYSSPAPAIWALEVNQGWFEKNGVRVGDRVKLYK
ncbi:MAG: DUF192 domain-containing protein [Deltaproteobacteria bacterium]|uniref:DUF192 domain-containing protein n=1 Tax=Candidatus Zymogenus saltonus TaxID=2844893 RepID=A0A9D8KG34_9DELT|nr:DUF192 domain-containing protein [Candidatus Zymogenus saltonus]